MERKKIAAIAAVVILMAALLYFYSAGEAAKQDLVYSPREQGSQDMSAVVILSLATFYLETNPNAEFPALCEADYLACVDQIAPNAASRKACKNAVIKIKEMTSRIENENSVLLGFNNILGQMRLDAACPEPPLQAEYFDNPALMNAASDLQFECIQENNIDFYGSSAATAALSDCFDELNNVSGGNGGG